MRKGVSLVEMLIVVAILGIGIFMVRVVADLINGFFQNSATAQVQREVQTTLFTITKDIRNCTDILWVSSDTLRLRMIDTRSGYDTTVNTNLFNTAFMSTMTYQYRQENGESYIQRTIALPGAAPDEKKLMKNLLVAPQWPDYVFNGCSESDFLNQNQCPPNTGMANPRGVDIRLTVSFLFIRNSQRTYTVRSMRRSR
jgi:prepilin-type N-terminal cleavage/methylation domain-containing protein